MKKHRFTWIDALVIAIVIMLIAGTCIKFLANDSTAVTQQTQELQYQIKASCVRQFGLDMLKVGDTIYETSGKGCVGTISDIQLTPAVTVRGLNDGTAREISVEDCYDAVITVTAQGVDEGDYYKIGTYSIRTGKVAIYFTKYVSLEGEVLSLG